MGEILGESVLDVTDEIQFEYFLQMSVLLTPKGILIRGKEMKTVPFISNSAKAIGCTIVNIGTQELVERSNMNSMNYACYAPQDTEEMLGLAPERIPLKVMNFHLNRAGYEKTVKNVSSDFKVKSFEETRSAKGGCFGPMELGSSELERVIKVYSAATASLIYAYYVIPRVSKAVGLLAILPVIGLFTVLPFSFHTFHLRGLTAFFLLWLGNFKLLLFAFRLPGPLSQPISLTGFLISALFPINVARTTTTPAPSSKSQPLRSSILFLTKLIIFLLIVIYLSQFQYKKTLHPHLLLLIYCSIMYLAIEIVLSIAALPVKLFLGSQFELDPHFNEPYLSTSLQDFWGRRWNLMVPTILRPSVYLPLRRTLAPIIGHFPASFAATFATFVVSGLMHEIIWFCLTSVAPTWEVTWFFVLHGVCTATEAAVKRSMGGRIKLPAVVSTPLTLGFLALTANWLFFPQLLRNGVDEWAISEYAPLVRLVTQTVTVK